MLSWVFIEQKEKTLTIAPKISICLPLSIVVATALACKVEEPTLPFSETPSLTTATAPATPGAPASPPPSSSGIPAVNGLTAPSIVSPLPGNSFTDPQPTLTVRNATGDGSKPTYDFQVAIDDGFRTVAAEGSGVPEGSDGTTAWRVGSPLGLQRYYWRARAAGAQGPGPYSPISDFFITTSSSPAPAPPGPGEMFDPLTNGYSVGEVRGGQFVSGGWQVRSRGDFIRYVVPTIESGFVEWENVGLTPVNPAYDLYTLFGMWDPSKGDYRENPYRVHVRKLDTQGHNPPYVRLRFISGGDQHDVGYDFLKWNPSQTYRWRMEWGPSGGGNEARVLLDGRVIIRTGYGPAYRPRDHWIELGIEERAESIVGIIYKNVRIGRR